MRAIKRKCILHMEPDRRDLKTRTLKELMALCWIMAIPYSGTKLKKIERIVNIWALRKALKDFKTPQELIAAFKAKELKEMCRTAKLWLGGNKYSKSASLLNWRNTARKKGQQRYEEVLKIKSLLHWGPM